MNALVVFFAIVAVASAGVIVAPGTETILRGPASASTIIENNGLVISKSTDAGIIASDSRLGLWGSAISPAVEVRSAGLLAANPIIAAPTLAARTVIAGPSGVINAPALLNGPAFLNAPGLITADIGLRTIW